MRAIRYIVVLSLLAVVLTSQGYCGNKIKVLFIGNSLTYVNDLPNMVAQMAKSRHLDMECDMYAPGGNTLKQHSDDKVTQSKIAEGKWDFVVLQEQSQIPAFPDEQLRLTMYPYADKLCADIRAANPKAHIVFYMTMARKNGDSTNKAKMPEIGTYSGMQKRLNKSYFMLAKENSAMTAPVGDAWGIVRSERPDIDMYGDEVHPNVTGTYLAACVFFNVFYKKSAVGLYHPPFVDDATAHYLQRIADQACRETKWNRERN
jgi:hypothetical protein